MIWTGGRARWRRPYCDRPFHDRRHALPVQSVLARRSLPTQLARQHRHRIGKRRGHSRPRLGPGKVLHPHAAPRAMPPGADGSAASTATSSSTDRAIPAPASRCEPPGIAAGRPRSAAAVGPAGRCARASNSSVSSTLVTVCAFRRSCFLIKVSMSTSVLFPSLCFGKQLRRIESSRGAAQERPSTPISWPSRVSNATTLFG